MGPAGDLRGVASRDVAARRDVALGALARLDASDADWERTASPLSFVIVEALLQADAVTLGAITDPLRHAVVDISDDAAHGLELRGYLTALHSVAFEALERLPSPHEFAFAPESHSAQFLRALAPDRTLKSSELKQRLATSDSQLSRTGRALLGAGLVVQQRAGRTAMWELTPRGRQAVPFIDASRARNAR